MTFDTGPGRWKLVVVLMLLASSGIGNPGMTVPKSPPSGEYDMPLRKGDLSVSELYEGASETTGVKETSGGAGLERTAERVFGLSATECLEDRVDCEC